MAEILRSPVEVGSLVYPIIYSLEKHHPRWDSHYQPQLVRVQPTQLHIDQLTL